MDVSPFSSSSATAPPRAAAPGGAEAVLAAAYGAANVLRLPQALALQRECTLVPQPRADRCAPLVACAAAAAVDAARWAHLIVCIRAEAEPPPELLEREARARELRFGSVLEAAQAAGRVLAYLEPRSLLASAYERQALSNDFARFSLANFETSDRSERGSGAARWPPIRPQGSGRRRRRPGARSVRRRGQTQSCSRPPI